MTFGPDLVMEAEEIVHRIHTNLKAAKSHQEHYGNKRHWPLTFTIGDHMYLCVFPVRCVKRFEIKGKLAPHYIGPFLILEMLGAMVSHPVSRPKPDAHRMFAQE
jgi:hypothetical protein